MDNSFKIDIDAEIKKNVDAWLHGDYDEESKSEIQDLLSNDPGKLKDAFLGTLKFSTGGIRGLVGVGPNRINKYTVSTLAQGITNCLKDMPKDDEGLSVLIGYDCRQNSKFLALEAAKVFAGNNIKVYLFKDLRPTPLISFGCRLKHCKAALMITASHNPPEYNGCKVYWTDGAQVLGASEKLIIEEITKITHLNEIEKSSDINHPKIIEIDQEIEKAYVEMSSHLQNYREDNQLHGKDIKIIYSSLHGTGITLLPQVFMRWGFTTLSFVDSQITADGTFPTVKKPNPEDPESLTLGLAMLKETKGDILIVTDPDADRIGVAIKIGDNIEIINGNQIAVLLLSHICQALTTKNKLAANAAFVKSIVTTELFQSICDYYQKPCFNVLPGFKYISEKIRQWENEPRGNQFIFGAEESYGYLYGTHVRDKDAIITAALIAEMALQAKLQGKTLLDNLNELYTKFGVYHEEVQSLALDDFKDSRKEMLEKLVMLRRMPPRQIGDLNVLTIEDYERSIKIDFTTHASTPLAFAKANILVFWLEDGTKLVVRPSGTEPKIKIYCSVVEKLNGNLHTSLESAKHRTKDLIRILIGRLRREDI